MEELEKVELARLVASAKVAALEDLICALWSERANDMEMPRTGRHDLMSVLGGWR